MAVSILCVHVLPVLWMTSRLHTMTRNKRWEKVIFKMVQRGYVTGLDTATNIQTDPSTISTGPGAESDIYYTIALLRDAMSAAACYIRALSNMQGSAKNLLIFVFTARCYASAVL